MAEGISHVSSENWKEEVLESGLPVLVDFWAEWCGPCRAMNPILEALAADRADTLKVVKVNVDENHTLAGEFGIRSIPTLLVVKEGTVQEQMVGALNKDALEEKLAAYL